MTQPLLQAADLRGATRLTTDAVVGLASLVEAMHARIARPPWLPRLGGEVRDDERTRGLTGLVYKTVRGVTHLVGGSTEHLLGWIEMAMAEPGGSLAPRAERKAVLAALNGVLGDHLAATDNPLALSMAFRQAGRALPLDRPALRARLPQATPRLLVLLHGLCMNDLQWQRDGHDHGEALARAAGYTPVYLHYNSGLSISTNGRILAALLEQLFDAWPVPIERLALLGHSMGGLVARSAIFHSAQLRRGGLRWPARLDDLVCLGSPHLGAPLEQAGQGVDLLLGAAPYAGPLARIGRLRSAGIQDLRRGSIVGSAAEDGDGPRAAAVALPPGVRCCAVAARLGAAGRGLAGRLLGDGLVPVASALGQDPDPAHRLDFPPERQMIADDTGHLELLSSPAVSERLAAWLS
ncbi:alpha/beta hydrolase [Ideonella sp. 4Y11]|uniref:Alpha/beta hydrolase n=1 Tax=Ideonella aquatica TaxID=2824119 RepID=A0A940YKZ6_9BURK|nr:alpha/beta hydrolase [Ideonella aquatica]MBQ0958201.1 alpha/beta hydrolase [Ideonella aquatica]